LRYLSLLHDREGIETYVTFEKYANTRTEVSHLLRYLKNHVGFIYSFISGKEKKELISQANTFIIEDIKIIYEQEEPTMPQTSDKLIFAFGICTLAISSELARLRVENLSIGDDRIVVSVHRKKA